MGRIARSTWAYRVSKRRSYRGAAATCMICARRRHSVGRTDGRTCNGATRVILRRDQFLGVQTFARSRHLQSAAIPHNSLRELGS